MLAARLVHCLCFLCSSSHVLYVKVGTWPSKSCVFLTSSTVSMIPPALRTVLNCCGVSSTCMNVCSKGD